MASKKVFITGITGQDGSYLAELLLNLGYQVAGIVRDKIELGNITHLSKVVKVYEVKLEDFEKLKFSILDYKPNQIYNLGGVTNLSAFEENISYATKITEEAPRIIFDTALKLHKNGHSIKVFQASSCLIFGAPTRSLQNEKTPTNPIIPYAKAKLRVDLYAQKLREKEALNISCGILYNHESPRRPLDYVTRKITAAAACIYNKVKIIPVDRFNNPILVEDFKLKLGNINIKRDWGHAKDFVRAFARMLEQERSDDYVIATGKTHNVMEILEIAFGSLNLDWRDYVIESEESVRDIDPNTLCGDITKARIKLDWKPEIEFEALIKEMLENDVKIFSK